MNEREMIGALDRALKAAQESGLASLHAEDYFLAGEWLLALEELEAIEDAAYRTEFADSFRDIRAAMGNPPDPMS